MKKGPVPKVHVHRVCYQFLLRTPCSSCRPDSSTGWLCTLRRARVLDIFIARQECSHRGETRWRWSLNSTISLVPRVDKVIVELWNLLRGLLRALAVSDLSLPACLGPLRSHILAEQSSAKRSHRNSPGGEHSTGSQRLQVKVPRRLVPAGAFSLWAPFS